MLRVFRMNISPKLCTMYSILVIWNLLSFQEGYFICMLCFRPPPPSCSQLLWKECKSVFQWAPLKPSPLWDADRQAGGLSPQGGETWACLLLSRGKPCQATSVSLHWPFEMEYGRASLSAPEEQWETGLAMQLWAVVRPTVVTPGDVGMIADCTVLLSTEQAGTYLQSSFVCNHLTYINPSLFDRRQNWEKSISVSFKL